MHRGLGCLHPKCGRRFFRVISVTEQQVIRVRSRKLVAAAAMIVLALMVVLAGCAPKYPYLPEATGQMRYATKYKIGPGDSLTIFVWRYPEVSTSVSVRSDGFVTAPLLEDVPAVGKTPTELARDLERELSVYLRDPLVSVIVGGGQEHLFGADSGDRRRQFVGWKRWR